MPTPRIKIGIKHLNCGKSSKYGFLLDLFWNLLDMADEEEGLIKYNVVAYEKEKQKICEEYKFKFNFCRNWTDEEVWKDIMKSYNEYWDYLHYDAMEIEKENQNGK